MRGRHATGVVSHHDLPFNFSAENDRELSTFPSDTLTHTHTHTCTHRHMAVNTRIDMRPQCVFLNGNECQPCGMCATCTSHARARIKHILHENVQKQMQPVGITNIQHPRRLQHHAFETTIRHDCAQSRHFPCTLWQHAHNQVEKYPCVLAVR